MKWIAGLTLGFLLAGGVCHAGPGDTATLDTQLASAAENADEIRGFLELAADQHGPPGARAAKLLVANMPERDLVALDMEFLLENLRLAFVAREEFPWAKDVPEEIFLNDVLPYASLDETRESWRPEFLVLARDIVKDSKTATEAAQALNRDLFNKINVHYDTGRKRPNQSPSESRAISMATCTGLSIILVNACRAVGVPARVAGTAQWTNKRGNHTWVEVWDGAWHFTGADEFNQNGLNRAWFTADAARAVEDDRRHAIWASSWRTTGDFFPLVWAPADKSVPAVNVTSRYKAEDRNSVAVGMVPLHLRVFDTAGGRRLVTNVGLLDEDGKVVASVRTHADATDLNDMPTLRVPVGVGQVLRLDHDGDVKTTKVRVESETTLDLIWDRMEEEPVDGALAEVKAWLDLPADDRQSAASMRELTRDEATVVVRLVFEKLANEEREARTEELKRASATVDGSIKLGSVKAAGKEMSLLERTFGPKPQSGHSLWISMHGGGHAPARVNDQQWKNQIALYQPDEGIYVAPRAPTNTWNLWHEAHMDDLLDRLIGNYIISRNVDPDRVYVMGYSAGGDGIYQIAPRMADRFAAAAMMAGHPNDASPLGLRNLPFMIWMGANDAAHKRNQVAAEWGRKLELLAGENPGGYPHQTHILEAKGHWMDREDAAAVPWMAKHVRNPWPEQVVWHQSRRTHRRFYWLAVPEEAAEPGKTVRAAVEGQTISLQADAGMKLILRLHDALVDLDQPVVVTLNDKEVFNGRVPRSPGAILSSLRERLDPKSAAVALLEVGGG